MKDKRQLDASSGEVVGVERKLRGRGCAALEKSMTGVGRKSEDGTCCVRVRQQVHDPGLRVSDWNHFSRYSGIPSFEPRPRRVSTVHSALAVDAPDFEEKERRVSSSLMLALYSARRRRAIDPIIMHQSRSTLPSNEAHSSAAPFPLPSVQSNGLGTGLLQNGDPRDPRSLCRLYLMETPAGLECGVLSLISSDCLLLL